MELMKASSSLYWETVVMLNLGEVSLTCMWVMELVFFFLYSFVNGFSAVFEEYRKLSGYEIEESIQKETSGTLQEVLLAVGKTYRHTHTHTHTHKHTPLAIKYG